jgi:predicted ribosomally synthesized peptide with SipW-like signal peptide
VKKTSIIVGAALVIVVGATLALWTSRGTSTVKFDTTYQAVLLDNNQVYYGKVQGLGTPFPVLTDVYYIQQQVNQQTKEVKNVLVRRGTEWHAPDRMVINANHIILVEPVGANSKVAQLIADSKAQGH